MQQIVVWHANEIDKSKLWLCRANRQLNNYVNLIMIVEAAMANIVATIRAKRLKFEHN